MKFEFRWEPSLVVCRISGVPKVEDFAASSQAMISSPTFKPGMDIVADLSELDVSVVTSADVERIAAELAGYTEAFATGRLILVTGGSPSRFGLTRMFEAYLGPRIEASILIFETLDEALACIRPADFDAAPETAAEELGEADVSGGRKAFTGSIGQA